MMRMFKPVLSALFTAGLWAAANGAAAAVESVAKTSVSSTAVRHMGNVSIDELVKRAAHAPPLKMQKVPVEMPRHRRPGGNAAGPAAPFAAFPQTPSNVGVGVAPRFPTVTHFLGINSKDSETVNGFDLEPPDQGLAVNNNVAAEITNLVLRFFNASTGAALTPPLDLNSFFLSGGGGFFGNFLSDPQAFFDPTTGRWFFTIIETNFFDVERFDIAVSATSDPLGGYFVYHVEAFSKDIPGCPGFIDCLPDFPHAGYDANGLYISVNLFGFGGFVGAATYALPKARLEKGGVLPFTTVRIAYPGDFDVQPSVPAPNEPFVTAANGTELLMEAREIYDRSTNVRVWAISNTNNIVSSPLSLVGKGVDVAVQSYGMTVPATEPNVMGTLCTANGEGATPLLDGVFESFTATIQMANGHLFGALPFGTMDANGLLRDSVAWFVLAPSVDGVGQPSATVFAQGKVVPAAGYSLLAPAFAVARIPVGGTSASGILGFSITNKSSAVTGGFPSAAFIQFALTPTTVAATGSIVVSGPGIGADDGFTGCFVKPFGVGRWGDYGAATIDSTTGFFYTANENISGARTTFTNWGTFITQAH